jgi:transposase-like protein
MMRRLVAFEPTSPSNRWEQVGPFFASARDARKMIYSTNAIEADAP